MNVVLINSKTGSQREVKLGYAWSVFWFGMFATLYYGDWKWSTIIFVTALILSGIGLPFLGVVGTSVLAAVYNKMRIKDLLQNGYRAKTNDGAKLIENYLKD